MDLVSISMSILEFWVPFRSTDLIQDIRVCEFKSNPFIGVCFPKVSD
jgi:hypothetical protein